MAYTAYVAPGLLASSAMNGAVFDSTFNIFFKLKIAKTYDAMLSTPLAPDDIALGELSWALLRGSIYSAAFLLAMTGFGYVLTRWAVLCFPAAILMNFAFAGVGMAATSYMRCWQDFDKVSLAIIPLFLFSATFYPLTVYPAWLQVVVRCTPLYQGVALIRGLDAGLFSVSLLGHAAYLGGHGTPRLPDHGPPAEGPPPALVAVGRLYAWPATAATTSARQRRKTSPRSVGVSPSLTTTRSSPGHRSSDWPR